MKKFLLTFLLFFLSLATCFGASVSLEVQVLEEESNVPITNLVVRKQEGLENTQTLVTNEEGKIIFTFEYTEDGNPLQFRINGNNISIQSLAGETSQITILYNTEKQEIGGVNYNGTYTIDNQRVIAETNYKGLLIYMFFTISLALIIALTRIFYPRMELDILKHR